MDIMSITYSNGLTQSFTIIDHTKDYLNIIKPSEKRISEIENLTKRQQKKLKEELINLKTLLSNYNFQWVTNASPIFKSLFNQKLQLPDIQGGTTNVKTVITTTLEYWDRESELKPISKLIKTISITDTIDNIFKNFYARNRQLRYCNGSYWKFSNNILERRYKIVFFPKYNTVENYYGGGVVD
jgi:hypothetical protein